MTLMKEDNTDGKKDKMAEKEKANLFYFPIRVISSYLCYQWFTKKSRTRREAGCGAKHSESSYFFLPSFRASKNLMISIGRGKTMVEFFSTAISARVCR